MQVGRLPSSLLMFLFFLNKDLHFTFIENPAFKIFGISGFNVVVYFIATGIYVPSAFFLNSEAMIERYKRSRQIV